MGKSRKVIKYKEYKVRRPLNTGSSVERVMQERGGTTQQRKIDRVKDEAR